MTVQHASESTGEVVELDAGTVAEVISGYRYVNDQIALYEALKKKLQKRAQELGDSGEQLEHDGYGFRIYSTVRKNYDKAVLREVLDEDTYDLMMEPSKKRVDEYLKENLEALGADSTRLRDSMVPAGRAYTTVRLERLTEEAA